MRPHDHDIGAFTAIFEQYGADSVEHEVFEAIKKDWKQQTLPFGETA